MLQVKNVSKVFGKIKALEDVSFDVKPGEFVFITGESGAGKTTLLRLILREMVPDTGKILLEDKDITKLKGKDIPKLRQKIGTVFQDFKVLPERTLWENVAVALSVCGVPQNEWDDRVEQVLKLVELKERMNLFPSQLSGGELQRASLARALVVNPKIVLDDEPTGNLDWDTADSIMDLFKKINSEGKTIIMATHHQLIVKKTAKRVVQLKGGKVVENLGSKSKPATSEKKESEVQKDKESTTALQNSKSTGQVPQNNKSAGQTETKKVEVKVKKSVSAEAQKKELDDSERSSKNKE
jgi:cell division transport system ATP-binding protein